MSHWPWAVGGLALAAIMVGHWLVTARMMAVSGRITAIVDRIRFGAPAQAPDMTDAELMEAMRQATLDAFGAEAVKTTPEVAEYLPPVERRRPQGFAVHVVFLASLAAGGFVSALSRGDFSPVYDLRGEVFARLSDGSALRTTVILLVGGALVGAGTRMAGGCTSGHGLCGVSRFQLGSVASTLAFFGAGVAVSFLLGFVL